MIAKAVGSTVCLLAIAGGSLVIADRYTPPAVGLDASPFPSSCTVDAQAALNRGAAWLHAFSFDLARRAFEAANDADPDCALAAWGRALTWAGDLATPPSSTEEHRAREALARAAERPPSTARERAYVAAGAALFAPNAAFPDRLRAYRDGLAAIVAGSPDDRHAHAWLALATLRAPGGDPRDRARRVAAALESAFGSPPRWAPAAHYLLLACDHPADAERGRAAAEWYARNGPPTAYTRRIASRIFFRLGAWTRVASLNEEAWRLAVEERSAPSAARSSDVADSLKLRHLALVQLGRWREAATLIGRATLLSPQHTSAESRDAFSSTALQMIVRAALEQEQWSALAEVPVAAGEPEDALRWFARAIGHARMAGKGATRDALAAAQHAAARLDALAAAPIAHRRVAIMRAIARATIAAMQEEREDMKLLLDEALRVDRLPADGDDLPIALWPPPQAAGDLWLLVDRVADARRDYADAQERYPGRARTLLGLARAAARHGDAALANRAYSALSSLWSDADPDVPWLAEARKRGQSNFSGPRQP